ncbi:uncharacterized protein LOC100679023 isoform X2 [Nasonia vitripennis]|uniref:Leucine-rich repeat-containing protein 27 n=1 Tax=Nasonia vitripennis TaxID=7425 RepID=A0A7M7GCB3_NASVI|nr:uncharacterized protein LOC100679023 isoform X2 [Nasonia vitripennis]
MSEDINKHLLSQFYGFRGDDSERKFLSSSKGIESFENLTDVECLSTEHLISSEETGKNQYTEEESEKVYDENNEGSLSKSPHVLTIEDLLKENEKTLESEDLNSEPEIIDDPKDDKNVPTKNFTRLEDTFTKAMAKASETPVQGDMNSSMTSLNMSFTASPVTKAKRLWRQKTILARENVITSPNLLEKFSGTHLNLNNAGICVFPVDILQQLTCLQMLYLDSNNLVELPDEIFTTLKNLKWLDVRNNHLVIIPSCVKGHASLETLLLQGNNIEKLPLELGLVPNLKNLQVAHNPLTFPPKEILDLDCSRIINFLRTMWNVEHPNETIQLRKLSDHKIEKKPSTIICYQPRPLIKLVKSSRYSMLAPKTSKTSVRSKTLNYKPSSRCQSAGGNIAYQQKMLWMATAKELLQDQAAKLQRSIDRNALEQWRYSYKRPHSRRSDKLNRSLSAPFALHDESFEKNLDNERKVKSSRGRPQLNSSRFNENFNELVESLKKLGDARASGRMSPMTEKNKIKAEIEKIAELQKKLQDLKFYNDSVNTPYEGSENLAKKYVTPPSIII